MTSPSGTSIAWSSRCRPSLASAPSGAAAALSRRRRRWPTYAAAARARLADRCSACSLVVARDVRMRRGRSREPLARLDDAAGAARRRATTSGAGRGDDELARLAEKLQRMAPEIAERERRITQLAFNDTLTGLPNRAHVPAAARAQFRAAERQRRRGRAACASTSTSSSRSTTRSATRSATSC